MISIVGYLCEMTIYEEQRVLSGETGYTLFSTNVGSVHHSVKNSACQTLSPQQQQKIMNNYPQTNLFLMIRTLERSVTTEDGESTFLSVFSRLSEIYRRVYKASKPRITTM